jgi:hypothetical protein
LLVVVVVLLVTPGKRESNDFQPLGFKAEKRSQKPKSLDSRFRGNDEQKQKRFPNGEH